MSILNSLSNMTVSVGLFGALAAVAMPVAAEGQKDTVSFDWTGLYAGIQNGAALDHSKYSNPYGQTLFGDDVRSPGGLLGAHVGYNLQRGRTVIGAEAEFNWGDFNGSFTCMQAANTPTNFFANQLGGTFGATCHTEPQFLGTITGRLGRTVGKHGRGLLYGKAGAAWVHTDIEMAINNVLGVAAGPTNARSTPNFSQWGWTVGGGLEYALTSNWLTRFEYDFHRFGDHGIATPQSGPFGFPAVAGIAGSIAPDGRQASVAQNIHAIKLGLTYKFGNGNASLPWDWTTRSLKDGPLGLMRSRKLEVGTRYVYTWGRFQKDLANPAHPLPSSNSRLTWEDMSTHGPEMFWRLDTERKIMLKGIVGAGWGDDGHINDEDWGLIINQAPPVILPYSNTDHPTESKIRYYTVDAGYSVLKGPDYAVTPFVGYNLFRQKMDALGCTQVATSPPSPCAQNGLLVLEEDDTWKSLRVGASVDLKVTNRLKLSGDLAYLPYVIFDGVDNHPLRTGFASTFSAEKGVGRGTQLEGVVSFDFTDRLSVGVGGRYWAMSIPDGEVDFFNTDLPVTQRFAVEHAAIFAQGSFKFGGRTEAAAQ